MIERYDICAGCGADIVAHDYSVHRKQPEEWKGTYVHAVTPCATCLNRAMMIGARDATEGMKQLFGLINARNKPTPDAS